MSAPPWAGCAQPKRAARPRGPRGRPPQRWSPYASAISVTAAADAVYGPIGLFFRPDGPIVGKNGAVTLRAGPRPRAARGYAPDVSAATLQTNQGAIAVELFDDDAPKTVDNFVTLARKGFYDGVIFHRVIPDFMVQGGDPTGTGSGGPGYTFEDEFNEHPVARGALAMANAGPNTNGSQFFIVTADACPWLDGKHTVFGRVTSGMDVVDAISALDTDARDRPSADVVIESVELDPQ